MDSNDQSSNMNWCSWYRDNVKGTVVYTRQQNPGNSLQLSHSSTGTWRCSVCSAVQQLTSLFVRIALS